MKTLILIEQQLDELKKSFDLRIQRFSSHEQTTIQNAINWAEDLHRGQKRASGEPYIIHPIQVAGILSNLLMDCPTVIAGLLHDVLEDTQTNRAELAEKFGEEVASLVDGVTKIHILHAKTKSVQEAETIRKMFFAMIKDIRVILIKLADKVHNMSTLSHLPDHKIKRIATECLDIYAPLAERLGISSVKNQLEDMALKHLDKDAYYLIKSFVDSKRGEREQYLIQVEESLLSSAQTEDIAIRVDARAKHFYSIYNKWKKSGKELEEVFDMLGVRIYCQTATECYTLLGLVHRLWKPIAGRFKDYIAMPKDNGYQSLHTTVMCFGGKLTEIQIRTEEMHETAEFGIAAHWVYKRGKSDTRSTELAIVNRLKSWQSEMANSDNFLEEIKGELLKDSIYVFTPKGKVVELHVGATALDFAFTIHTEVGLHCIGAKADGSIIPLSYELRNTQVIEILTNPNAHPNIGWLQNAKTNRSRSKIRHWLAHNDEGMFLDKNIVAKKKSEVIEAGKRSRSLNTGRMELPKSPLTTLGSDEPPQTQSIMDASKVGIQIGDEKNLKIQYAKCCNPSVGDPIVGFVSRGRGIIIHRKNCTLTNFIPGFDQRRVEVQWVTNTPKITRGFKLIAKYSSDLFSEIEGAIRKFKGHLIEGKLEDDHHGHMVGTFTIELEAREETSKIMKAIRAIPSVNFIEKTR